MQSIAEAKSDSKQHLALLRLREETSVERARLELQVGLYKSTNTDAAARTKVQILTQLLVQKYKF